MTRANLDCLGSCALRLDRHPHARARLAYLEVALASIVPQAAAPAPRCW